MRGGLIGVVLLLVLGCGGLMDKGADEITVDDPVQATPPAATAPTPPPKAPPAAPPPPSGDVAATPPQKPFNKVAFACCANERAQRIVSEYLDLHQALAEDNVDRARAEVHAVRGVALAATKEAGLSANSRVLAQQVADLLQPALDADIQDIRDVFDGVSNKVITLAQANQGGAKKVAVAFCSQANANWLQDSAVIANPYQGSAAPRCGGFR